MESQEQPQPFTSEPTKSDPITGGTTSDRTETLLYVSALLIELAVLTVHAIRSVVQQTVPSAVVLPGTPPENHPAVSPEHAEWVWGLASTTFTLGFWTASIFGWSLLVGSMIPGARCRALRTVLGIAIKVAALGSLLFFITAHRELLDTFGQVSLTYLIVTTVVIGVYLRKSR